MLPKQKGLSITKALRLTLALKDVPCEAIGVIFSHRK